MGKNESPTKIITNNITMDKIKNPSDAVMENITQNSQQIKRKMNHSRVKSMVTNDFNAINNPSVKSNLDMNQSPFFNAISNSNVAFEEIVKIYKSKSIEDSNFFRMGEDLNKDSINKINDCEDPNYKLFNMSKLPESYEYSKKESFNLDSIRKGSVDPMESPLINRSPVTLQNFDEEKKEPKVGGGALILGLFGKVSKEPPQEMTSVNNLEKETSSMSKKNGEIEDKSKQMNHVEMGLISMALLEHRKKVEKMLKDKIDKKKQVRDISHYKDLVDSGLTSTLTFKHTNGLHQLMLEKKIYTTKADKEIQQKLNRAKNELSRKDMLSVLNSLSKKDPEEIKILNEIKERVSKTSAVDYSQSGINVSRNNTIANASPEIQSPIHISKRQTFVTAESYQSDVKKREGVISNLNSILKRIPNNPQDLNKSEFNVQNNDENLQEKNEDTSSLKKLSVNVNISRIANTSNGGISPMYARHNSSYSHIRNHSNFIVPNNAVIINDERLVRSNLEIKEMLIKNKSVHMDKDSNNKFQAVFQKKIPIHKLTKNDQIWTDVYNNLNSDLFGEKVDGGLSKGKSSLEDKQEHMKRAFSNLSVNKKVPIRHSRNSMIDSKTLIGSPTSLKI